MQLWVLCDFSYNTLFFIIPLRSSAKKEGKETLPLVPIKRDKYFKFPVPSLFKKVSKETLPLLDYSDCLPS